MGFSSNAPDYRAGVRIVEAIPDIEPRPDESKQSEVYGVWVEPSQLIGAVDPYYARAQGGGAETLVGRHRSCLPGVSCLQATPLFRTPGELVLACLSGDGLAVSPRPDGSDTTQEQTSTLWECADDGYELLPGFGGDRRGSLQSRLEALGLGPVADAIGAEGASERRFRGVTSIGDHRLELRLGPLCGASDAVIAYWVRASMQRNAQVSDAKLTGRFHATLLHNALNVLNSANVAASTVETVLARSKVSSLGRLASLVAGPVGVPNEFLWTNPAGREIPRALWLIAEELEKEREQLQAEALHLRRSIGHVKRILQSQPASGGRDAGRSYEELLELAHGLSGLSTQRDIQVERRCNASCSCHVDEDRFLQVLVNLLSNARHSILRAGIQGRIELSVAQRSNGWVSVGVSDNGIGIDDTALSALFSWGFTTRGDGHGVGLAASAHAAREFCGTLTGASKGAGMGAIFTLELPPAAQGDS